MLKSDVRRIAHEKRLPTASRPESMGLCFVGQKEGRIDRFLCKSIGWRSVSSLTIYRLSAIHPTQTGSNDRFEWKGCWRTPRSVDFHYWAGCSHRWTADPTICYRKRLRTQCHHRRTRLVSWLHTHYSTYSIATTRDHPALFKSGLRTSAFNWIAGDPPPQLPEPGGHIDAQVKVSYGERIEWATVRQSK